MSKSLPSIPRRSRAQRELDQLLIDTSALSGKDIPWRSARKNTYIRRKAEKADSSEEDEETEEAAAEEKKRPIIKRESPQPEPVSTSKYGPKVAQYQKLKKQVGRVSKARLREAIKELAEQSLTIKQVLSEKKVSDTAFQREEKKIDALKTKDVLLGLGDQYVEQIEKGFVKLAHRPIPPDIEEFESLIAKRSRVSKARVEERREGKSVQDV